MAKPICMWFAFNTYRLEDALAAADSAARYEREICELRKIFDHGRRPRTALHG
jgi:hypothetical protein